jgi:hypothetical protein
MSKKVWTRAEIDAKLHTDPRWVERAMVRLFELQTYDEQRADQTKHHNNRGFCGWAAKRGSYYARWVKSGKRLNFYHLKRARKIALKHSRQLVDTANGIEVC